MSLTSNPFHVLGAKMTDDRRRIVALAKERSFGEDQAAVREAQRILLTPKRRLAAEIAWLGPHNIALRIAALAGPNSVAGTDFVEVWLPKLPALNGANLLAHMLVHSVALDASARQPVASEEFWAERIAMLAGAHQAVRADEVTALVNEHRLAAGVPIASEQDVIKELRARANSFRDPIEHCLDNLSMTAMVEVVTAIVDVATHSGSRHAPVLIDSLIDSYYERRMSRKMDEHEKRITDLVSRVREDVASGAGGRIVKLPARLEEIKRSLRTWDVLAQPVQVSLASRGMSHLSGDEIMRDTRNLAIELVNKYGAAFLSHALSLTKTLRQVFAEMEPITALLDGDIATLDEIAARVRRTASPLPTSSAASWISRHFYLPGLIVWAVFLAVLLLMLLGCVPPHGSGSLTVGS